MRAYLGLVAKDPRCRVEPHALAAAASAAGEAIPVPAGEVASAEWIGADHGVVLVSWSNEPDHELLPEPLTAERSRALGYCGYLADPVTAEYRLLTAGDLGSTIEEQGGCFSVFRAAADGIEAATSISRVCPVYYAETADLHIVGSRALLVHLVARSMETGLTRPGPDFDVMALQAMVRHGFFTTDETPFRGVRALPAASVLTLRRGEPRRIAEGRMPETAPAPRSRLEVRESVARLADALVDAAGPLVRHGQPVTLALSGGRDSRLMAAVLNAAGVPLRSRTHGFADDPDVILGTRIAAVLGVESKVALTDAGSREDTVSVAHPLARAHHVIRMCEGMTSAYEQVNGWQAYRLAPKTSGSGGETLRGGFLCGQQDLSPGGLRKRVRMIFHAGDRFLSPEANEYAETNHRPWAERARNDGFDVLDKLYLFYRTGRWIVGSHTATLMNGPYYHPFLDNRVVRETLTLPAAWRCSEEAVFGLLETLAPELAAIPPEGKRWRFEEHRPRSLREWQGWRRRAALVPKGRTSGFNWRTSYDEDFQTLLRDQIMTSPPELFDIVDEPAAKELLAKAPGASPKNIWHIYTLSVLLSGRWREAVPALPNVAIPLPARP